MDDLSYQLVQMCKRNRDGSYGTQQNRQRGLTAMAVDLRRLGYKLPGTDSLKPKHVDALVELWKGNDLDDASIRNRLTWLRWWAGHAGKPGVVERDNAAYGLAAHAHTQVNRARTLEPDKVNKIPCPYIRASLLLQAAFGLRREEAIKFRPSYAIQQNRIVLKSSWTKGGRARTIPIGTRDQHDALLNVQRLVAGDGSLIPANLTYAEQLKRYEYLTLEAGLRNTHGLRHAYAQRRYQELTGWACPLAGGKLRKDMTEAERERDRGARFQVSGELGHARLSITNVYLGRA